MKHNYIAWEKYENYVNNNLDIYKSMMSGQFINAGLEEEDEGEDNDLLENNFDSEYDEDEEDVGLVVMRFPMTPELLSSIKLSTNFNCWIGHTNFDITKSIEGKLNKIEGIELLKVLTRYRFLVGFGRTFDSLSVKHMIDKELQLGKKEK